MVVCLNCQVGFLTAVKCGCVCSAERDYEMQFWKEELEREINELEKSATELAVSSLGRVLCPSPDFFVCFVSRIDLKHSHS